VVRTVVGDRLFDPLPFRDQAWGCVQRGIESSDAAQRQAVEGDIDMPGMLDGVLLTRSIHKETQLSDT
ncbi:MAG: hypothetical protein ACK57P_14640, partial [Planctomycetota bacterium]